MRFLAAAFVLLVIGCSPGSVQSLGFGTGRTSCAVSGTASTFQVGQAVHMAATFEPAPTHVDIVVTHDGLADDHSGGIDLAAGDNCVIADFTDLVAGHYVVVLTPVPAAGVPPLSGEFDVKT